jgi:hypothetical protein
MDFNDALNSMIFTKLIKITTVNMLHQPSHVKQKKMAAPLQYALRELYSGKAAVRQTFCCHINLCVE